MMTMITMNIEDDDGGDDYYGDVDDGLQVLTLRDI